MFHIVLYEPEIPPNTGNVMRLAANAGCRLHLIRPLGFELDDKLLRRAGLDYREWADTMLHDSIDGPLRHHLTAIATGPRPEVDYVVRGSYRFFVVLHHEDGVTEISQISECR